MSVTRAGPAMIIQTCDAAGLVYTTDYNGGLYIMEGLG